MKEVPEVLMLLPTPTHYVLAFYESMLGLPNNFVF